ncbi:hypothetical protein HaLaN_28882 [Haematococcus lacustris]|uniref:Uncharacterized protein n=1 Tax=Haematococcus lacustris TaxID=44745 RepID=A0A6A0AE10_HAELA|nr:hypothetical protein HaLaN_28882 [Haematococcus lacustris]
MSSYHWPHDGLPTPPAPMKGSRSKPGGLNLDCTSGSIAGAAPSLMPLHTTIAIGANATNATEIGALCSEFLHEDYQPHVGDS